MSPLKDFWLPIGADSRACGAMRSLHLKVHQCSDLDGEDEIRLAFAGAPRSSMTVIRARWRVDYPSCNARLPLVCVMRGRDKHVRAASPLHIHRTSTVSTQRCRGTAVEPIIKSWHMTAGAPIPRRRWHLVVGLHALKAC